MTDKTGPEVVTESLVPGAVVCQRCGKVFVPENSAEDALAEMKEKFGDLMDDGSELVVVCDTCYSKLEEWLAEGICGITKHGYVCARKPLHGDGLHAATTSMGMMAVWRDGQVGVNVRHKDPGLWESAGQEEET